MDFPDQDLHPAQHPPSTHQRKVDLSTVQSIAANGEGLKDLQLQQHQHLQRAVVKEDLEELLFNTITLPQLRISTLFEGNDDSEGIGKYPTTINTTTITPPTITSTDIIIGSPTSHRHTNTATFTYSSGVGRANVDARLAAPPRYVPPNRNMSVQSLHVGSAFPSAISQSIRTNGVNSINGGVNGVNGVGYNHNPNNQTYNSASLNGSVGSGLTVYPPGLVASISVDYAQCFNVPFTNIPGPPREDIMYCTPGAVDRWTHPEGSPPDAPASALPVHKKAVDDLRAICRQHSDDIYCNVTVLESQGRTSSMSGRKQRGMVATVIMSGQEHSVVKMRERILQKAAIMLKSDSVDLEAERLLDSEGRVFDYVRNQLIKISEMTGADMFILKMHVDTLAKGFDPRKDCSQKEKVRVAIYGSTDVVEHAKTRLLIYIDQLVCCVDVF